VLAGRQGGVIEIVGVARDSVYLYPAEMPQKMLYLPLRQNPRGIMVLLAQTSGASAEPLPAMREIIRRADSALSAYDAHTIERFYDALAVSIFRIVLTMVSGIGLMGVMITVIGLYGLVSYAVNRRVREIGVRAALGATYARLLAMLMRQGLTPVWIGVAGGIALSVITEATFSAMVPFSKAYDAWVAALLVPALCAVTAAAAFVPARRAALVDPMTALREE
jgi:ABC-type antimicrobial peptide transport system permease subunit